MNPNKSFSSNSPLLFSFSAFLIVAGLVFFAATQVVQGNATYEDIVEDNDLYGDITVDRDLYGDVTVDQDAYEGPPNQIENPPQTNTVPPPPPSTPSSRFTAGQRVQTIDNLNVRSEAAGNVLGVQSFGSAGTIVGGPVIAANGAEWYQINYDNGVDGWSHVGWLDAEGSTTFSAPQTVSSNFSSGGTVQVFNAGSGLNVRSEPAGSSRGTQSNGSRGTVIAGPLPGIIGGTTYSFVYVDFESGPDGWVADDFLRNPPPPPPPSGGGSGGGTVVGTFNGWSVTQSPPTLSNPRVIDVSSLTPVRMSAFALVCAGLNYDIRLGTNEDALIYMSGNTPLRYPVKVTGGRNVRIVGLDLDLITQPGCGVGQLPNNPVSQYPNSNIHPRIPNGMAIRLEQSHTSFVEGVSIDLNGHQADCFVTRTPDHVSYAQARGQRDIIYQNTLCVGNEGMGAGAIGDGIHADFTQNQGQDSVGKLVLENVTHRTGQEGVVVHGWGGGPREMLFRNFDYSYDRRYHNDDNYERWGLAVATNNISGPFNFVNMYIDDIRGPSGAYVIIDGQRYGAYQRGNIIAHPGINDGPPPGGAFAPSSAVGINYTSPHGGVPN